MAFLDTLQIRGIRSFDPNSDEEINFSTPLTLFWGPNGCGKTTIIECLKYALTGYFPALTDIGKEFANDSQLSYDVPAEAFVKLTYEDSTGYCNTIEKSFEVKKILNGGIQGRQLTSKKPNYSFHQKNAEDIGGPSKRSKLCYPINLDVSKGILDNVILCHQENSFWPLDEPKKLKEKFDKIFGFTKYDKCVDGLIQLMKEMTKRAEKLELKLKLKKKYMEDAKSSLLLLENEKKQLETIVGEINQIEIELESLNKEHGRKKELLRSVVSKESDLNSLTTQLKDHNKHQTDLKKKLPEEYGGTDEELDIEIKNFPGRQKKINGEISTFEEKRTILEDEIRDTNATIQRLQGTGGRLEEQESRYLENDTEMKKCVEEAKVKFNLITDINEPIQDIIEKLQHSWQEKIRIFDQLKANEEDEQQKLQKNIDDLNRKLIRVQENHRLNTDIEKEANIKKQNATQKLNSQASFNSKIEAVEQKIKNNEKVLHEITTTFIEEQEQVKLKDFENKIHHKKQRQNELNKEYNILQKNFVIEKNIERERNFVNKNERKIEELEQKHKQHFETMFEGTLQQENIRQAVIAIQERENIKIIDINKRIIEKERQAAGVESTLKSIKSNLESRKTTLQKNENEIKNVCMENDFVEVLNQTRNKKEELQKEKDKYRSTKTLFEEFINKFQLERPCCPVCETDFSDKKEMVDNIIEKLSNQINELPKQLNETENNLRSEEELYRKLVELQSTHDNVQKLKDKEIPLLDDELQQTEKVLKEVKRQRESLQNDIIKPKNFIKICETVMPDVVLMDQLNQEIKESKASIEKFKKHLIEVSSNRTIDQAKTDLSVLQDDLSDLQQRYNNEKDIYYNTKETINNLNENILSEKRKQMDQSVLETQIETYDIKIVQLKKEIAERKQEIDDLKGKITKDQTTHEEVIKKNKEEWEQRRLELDSQQKFIEKIQNINKDIKNYEKSENKRKLENNRKEKIERNEILLSKQQEKKIVSEEIRKKNTEMANLQDELTILKDNKELREQRKTNKVIENEIEGLKEKVGDRNSQIISNEMDKLSEIINSKLEEKNIKIGELNKIQENIKRYESTLNIEAINEYKREYYKFRVQELAAEDLATYSKCLEKSLLTFHEKYMLKINEAIKKLWKSIYKGNDIDYIEIQSDNETGDANRRSYNYKVVQVKNDIKLEMRGRCSAGQKVLACLVIRMALTQTLSGKCRFLALDDPTANLDKDNKEKLSQTLLDFITTFKDKESFQFIIITHDKEFFLSLVRNQGMSQYFHVYKNDEGFSRTKLRDVREIEEDPPENALAE